MSELETPGPVNDPIASLHRMSTTAGVGSAEYVAINNLAIVAAVLGLITALAFFGIPFMLIGAAAILCGAIALVQIARSNGTQGGRGVAWLGIVLAVLMAGGAFALDRVRAARQHEDEQAVNQVIHDFGQLIQAGQYARAYDQFDDIFKQQFPLAAFESQWKIFLDPVSGGGALQMFEGNGIFYFTPLEGGSGAMTEAKVRFARSLTEGRWRMAFILRPNTGWKILSLENFEPKVPQKKKS